MGKDDALVYPTGCKPVEDDMNTDELIRRLKTLAHILQTMGQDDGSLRKFTPLAMHLAQDAFMNHDSRDVQLLIACCIADVLRIYAPEAPYIDPDHIKSIFMFLIRQLNGLRDPKDPAFKRYFYLLENLAYVKSFNMCFDLEDSQEIFCALAALVFKIVNDEHSAKVKSFMLDLLHPLITESDSVSNELLDIILSNIVEPHKTQRKNAYLLAKELIVKCSDTLQPYIRSFFQSVMIVGNKDESNLYIARKIYDLLYELNDICPSVLLSVLPQLEFKLKSTDEKERMESVSLLARMFSVKDSRLAYEHKQLWRAFLGRFNDINYKIRVKCVQYSMHFLLNHPELRQDIVEALRLRLHDSEEAVRYEVVMAVVSTIRKDFSVVSDNEDLLNFIKERTLDKKFKIRKEAMQGLALIYKTFITETDVPDATRRAVTWIKDKILHAYYMPSQDDRLLIEKLFNTCLVPYTLPPEQRMRKLYYLYATIDENATRALNEMHKHQQGVRKHMGELIEQVKRSDITAEQRETDLVIRINMIARIMPYPVRGAEYLQKLCQQMLNDSVLVRDLEIMVNNNSSCKDSADAFRRVLKKLGMPVMTNLYHSTIKMLLERMSSVIVDHEALKHLIELIQSCLIDPEFSHELGIPEEEAGEKGLKLLMMLSYVYPGHFLHEDILLDLVSFLDVEENSIAPNILAVLTFVGKHKSLSSVSPGAVQKLLPLCERFAVTGTTKQAKNAVRCLVANVPQEEHEELFTNILNQLKTNLEDPSSEHYLTGIVSAGHIAQNVSLGKNFQVQMKNLVARQIVRELLMKELNDRNYVIDEEWIEESELPLECLCRVEGFKMLARWLIGLKTDTFSAQKTFRMITCFIQNKGDVLQTGKFGKAEMAWLRLAAGSAFLKICEQKGVGDQFQTDQFYTLSSLMLDDVPQVREKFSAKLNKGLVTGVPFFCLPLDFMGMYVYGGLEQDKNLRGKMKRYMEVAISKRRDYIRTMTLSGLSEGVSDALGHILPDYMLLFAITILTHCPEYELHDDAGILHQFKKCLWFILEPLINKNEGYSFGFYKQMIEKAKNCKDATNPNDAEMNKKLWTICDLAMVLILQKTTNFDLKEGEVEVRIPPMYFLKSEDPNWVNAAVYLPLELQHNLKNVAPSASISHPMQRTTKRPRITHNESKIIVGTIPMDDYEDEEEEEEEVPPLHKESRLDISTRSNQGLLDQKIKRLS
ncbi:sister chromatid cohesion protein PDS5 homolog B-like isoform X2 [Artemia franciscana]|uniref:Uncharacterized protein n=1 Tax=Artemia franciscana TaxID=6661 RepID=A0AA88I6R7_ARTSF|nr:hypothetical protein QYM36_010765 [Artemia franciscana]